MQQTTSYPVHAGKDSKVAPNWPHVIGNWVLGFELKDGENKSFATPRGDYMLSQYEEVKDCHQVVEGCYYRKKYENYFLCVFLVNISASKTSF